MDKHKSVELNHINMFMCLSILYFITTSAFVQLGHISPENYFLMTVKFIAITFAVFFTYMLFKTTDFKNRSSTLIWIMCFIGNVFIVLGTIFSSFRI